MYKQPPTESGARRTASVIGMSRPAENMAAAAVGVRVRVRVDKMRVFVLLCVCLFVKPRVSGETAGEETQKSCDVLYRDGVEAYLDERWQDCIDSLERAVAEYRTLKQNTVNCRINCQAEAVESPFMGPDEIDDLQFYEKMVRKTLCLLKCNKYNPKSGLNGLPKNAEKDFERLRPYEYLQLCYYQVSGMNIGTITVFSRAFNKLTGPHLVYKFPAFYVTRMFITAFTTARHFPLSRVI